MKYVSAILGVFFVALLNANGQCQDQTTVIPHVGTINIAKLQSRSSLKVQLDNEVRTLSTQLDAQFKQRTQNAETTTTERKLIGDQYQAQLTQAATEANASFTRAVKEAIAEVAQKRGLDLVLTDDAINLNDKDQASVTIYNTTPLSVVALARAGVDVTDDVVQQLNQQTVRQQPAVTSQSSGGATALPVPRVQTDVVLHGETLNPAFRFTGEDFIRAVEKGKQLAQKGKSIDEVFKPVAQMPRGVKGEKGKSHESTIFCTTLNAVDLTASAFKATNNYEPLQPPPSGLSSGGYAKQVHFFVSLVSVPKMGASIFDRNRLAGVDDVQVTKFVLTDDKGNIFDPLDVASANGVQSGSVDFSGVNRFNHVDTSQTNTNANAYAYDSNGNSVNASGMGTRTTTMNWTEYVPWSESHPYFSATYNVDFPLFDASGQPLIKTDAKSITLHIITPNGEKQVTYDLHPPKI